MEKRTEGPPRFAQSLLARILPAEDLPYILGDLAEEYHEYLASGRGRWRVRLWYWKQVGESVLPGVRQRLGGPHRPSRVPNRGDGIMASLRQDIRHAFRGLRRNPGFAAVAILTLALGIGANTAMFSVVNGVMLRPLPYHDPDRVVRVLRIWGDVELGGPTSSAKFLDWRRENSVFDDMAGFSRGTGRITGGVEPLRIRYERVTPNYFQLLGSPAALGRTILPDDNLEEGEPIVVLSHSLWVRLFGRDPSVIGESLRLNGEIQTIVGVMPPDFQGVELGYAQIWMLDPFFSYPRNVRSVTSINAIARLRPQVSLEQARTEMAGIDVAINETYPEGAFAADEGWAVTVLPVRDVIAWEVRRPLMLFLGSAGFVLLIACANLANLLLARVTTRQGEVAIRTAMGAGRLRLIRQFLTETLVLFGLGGLLGVFLAKASIPLILALGPPVPRLDQIGIDTRVIVFTVAVSLLTGIMFGLAPALRGVRTAVNESLSAGVARLVPGPRSQHGVNLLVVAELALSMVLLIGAALMFDSFRHAQRVHNGFNPRGVLTMEVNLPRQEYALVTGTGTTPRTEGQDVWTVSSEQAAFVDDVLVGLKGVPGVESAAAVNFLPKAGNMKGSSFAIEGQPAPPDMWRGLSSQGAWVRMITPDYFDAMSIPLLRGRRFHERDTEQSPDVVIISETVASRYWPDEDPIGTRIIFRDGLEDPWRPFEIVGVVGDVRQLASIFRDPEPQMLYIPYSQQARVYVNYQVAFRMNVDYVLKTSADLTDLASAMRQAVWAVDPDQPITFMRTMEEAVAETLTFNGFRFYTTLLTIFSALAIILAAIGVYGVMSNLVARRTREIGIRMALGARAEDVLRLVGRRGLILTTAGTVLGVAGALALTRLLSSWLYEVDPTDPSTFVVVSGFLVIVALLACFVPARRATKVDPMATLRTE